MSIERKLEREHQGLTPDEIEGIKIIIGIVCLILFLVWFGTISQGILLI
jgi:hypothetical protein